MLIGERICQKLSASLSCGPFDAYQSQNLLS